MLHSKIAFLCLNSVLPKYFSLWGIVESSLCTWNIYSYEVKVISRRCFISYCSTMSFSASLSAIRWGSIVPYPLPLTGFWMSFPTRADNFILFSRLTLNWLARGSLGASPSSYDGGARVFQATASFYTKLPNSSTFLTSGELWGTSVYKTCLRNWQY